MANADTCKLRFAAAPSCRQKNCQVVLELLITSIVLVVWYLPPDTLASNTSAKAAGNGSVVSDVLYKPEPTSLSSMTLNHVSTARESPNAHNCRPFSHRT